MSEQRTPLFVRLRSTEADRLDRAAFELKSSKQELVSRLIAHHLDEVKRVTVDLPDDGLTVGRAAFTPAANAEVLTLAGVAELLQVAEDAVRELAEAGDLPGRRVGDEWRFSREAVLRWLAGD